MKVCHRRILYILILLGSGLVPGLAREVQHHGVTFEQWVRDTFFDGYEPGNYTGKWDIPASVNTRYGGIPVNPKAIKYGTPIGLGDALRQYDIDEPFLLIVAYWQQEGLVKRFVKVLTVRMEPEQMRRLWAPVTREDIVRLDALIKDRETDYREVREAAKAMKNAPPFSEAVIQVNPKIDSTGQRRLQCSIRFEDVFKHLAPDVTPEPEDEPTLFGRPVIGPLYSPPRSFP
jgi:hypothetical protein